MLAIFAVLVRAFLPLGWKPSSDARTPLIICPMMGAMAHAPPGKQDAPQHHSDFCPFTASLAQLSTPASPTLLSLPSGKSAPAHLSATTVLVRAQLYRSQAPRGPPLA